MVKILVMICLLFVVACAVDDDTDGAGSNPPSGPGVPPTTRNFLKPISFSGNILELQTRFASYSKKAGRASIIDPIQQVEVIGWEAKGYNFAVALPGFESVALFGDRKLEIKTSSSSRLFNINSAHGHISIASKAAAYSLASIDGRSFEVVRSLGNGLWQQETFNVPWGVMDESITRPPANQPVLLATQFNDAGTMLAVYSPSDGRYAVLNAASSANAMLGSEAWCNGDNLGTPDNASFRSIVWDESQQIFFTGDRQGKLYAISPTGECADFSFIPTLDLGVDIPVMNLTLLGNGRIAVVQDSADVDGSFKTVSYGSGTFTLDSVSVDNVCEVPLSAMALTGGYITLLCSSDQSVANQNKSNAQNNIYVDPRTYITINESDNSIVSEIMIDTGYSSGIVIDPVTRTLYRMLEGAFGTLEIINLVSGEKQQVTGVLIKNILD